MYNATSIKHKPIERYMKFILATMIIFSALISVGMSNKEKLSEKMVSSFSQLQAPKKAYASSSQESSVYQFATSADSHIAKLLENKSLCKKAKDYLTTSYVVYKGTNIYDDEFNDKFTKESKNICK